MFKLKNFFTRLLIVACLFDLAFHNQYINPTVSENFFKEPSILKEIDMPAIIYREEFLPLFFAADKIEEKKIIYYYLNSFFPFSGIAYGAKYIFNRDFMNSYPQTYVELIKMVQRLSKNEKLKILNYIGCQYYIGSKPYFNPELAKKLFIKKFPIYVESISKELIRPFVVFNYVKADSLEKKLMIFLNLNFNPKVLAIIDADLNIAYEIGLQEIPPDNFYKIEQPITNSLEIIQEKSGYGKYIINLKKPGIVLFPGNWAKGWKAYIDGKKTMVFSANLFSKGIFIYSGEHKVILRYLPDSFIVGLSLSIFVLAFYIICWVIVYFAYVHNNAHSVLDKGTCR